MNESKIKIAVAMSGGVDSSVSAILLKEKGYDVYGVTLRLFERQAGAKKCGTQKEIDDAKNVCDKISINHFVYDYQKDFCENVIEKFICAYENGETPNPCVDCNRDVKFKTILENALNDGAQLIATGHYANIEYSQENDRYLLKKAADLSKDQTYFLYKLTQNELKHTVFPLGNIKSKDDVRKIASEYGLIVAQKADSQDICFISEKSYTDFIEKYRNKKYQTGNFVDKNKNILGKHKGIIYYTVGQRKGLGITLSKPVYVIEKNAETNEVVLGDEEDLYSKSLIVKNINLISVDKITEPMEVMAKVRYNHYEEPAVITAIDDDTIRVDFKEKQRAITAGQACVFYQGDYVVGGGTIFK